MAGDVDDADSFEALIGTLETDIASGQREQLWKYAHLLWEANRHVNLTRHTSSRLFVQRDLLDTVQLSRLMSPSSRALDIGSGGGVPGIPLAILRPDLQISLCESTGKKANLLKQFVQALKLPVSVYHQRAETVLQQRAFDDCVARAVGPLWKLCTVLRPHWPAVGRLLAVKGPNWRQEQLEAAERQLLKHLRVSILARYQVAETGAQSFVLEVAPSLQKTGRRKNNL